MPTILNQAKYVRKSQSIVEKKQREVFGMSPDKDSNFDNAVLIFIDKKAEVEEETRKQEGKIETLESGLTSNSSVKKDYEKMHENNKSFLRKAKCE